METVAFSEVIDVDENERTSDVFSDGSFKALLLSQSTLDSLQRYGFKKPSPVQVKAIPPGMTGLDMLVQAKSGTGKTLVFAILASENLNMSSKAVQKLVIAPTREIALQIGETIQKIAAKGVKIAVITGGTSVHEDKEKLKKGVHIVVGTTGRLCQLLNEDSLNLSRLSLLVLDEADKMMSGDFEKDVNFIYSCVSGIRQVAVFSATYPAHLASSLIPFLRSPIHIRLNANDVQLIGVKQYVSLCLESNPIDAAIIAFTSIQYKQAFLFCNKADDCPIVANRLCENGIEAAAISAQLEQSQREDVMKRLKSNKIKVVVSTDLTARGVDADNVDLVINLESPFEIETYLHRIGRAARYGGQGASLTIICTKKSLTRFSFIIRDENIRAKTVQLDHIPATLTTDRIFFDERPLFVSAVGKKWDATSDERKECIDDVENEENEDPIENEGVMTTDYSIMLNNALNLSSNLKGISTVNEIKEEVNAVENKKFKFVPSRAKKSTKYYMKGEMISIRDALTSDQWKEYAREKFDMTKEPFTVNENGNVNKHYKGNINTEKSQKSKIVNSTLPSTSTSNEIKEYTRKDLFAISKSTSAKAWKSYASSRWNLADEPFVEDQSLRCTYKDQIRLKRQREKAERDKVVAERNASRIRLISMGTSVSPIKVWDGSFEEYGSHMKEEMEKTKGTQRRGPIVNRRRDKDEYRRKVEDTKRIMEGMEKNYEYTLNMALKGINEGGVQTEMDILIMGEKNEEERSNIEIIKEIEEAKYVEKDENEEKLKENEPYEEECFEEDKECLYEDDEANYEEIEDENAHSRLHECYNRNIEFARVFNAYLNSMSTLHSSH